MNVALILMRYYKKKKNSFIEIFQYFVLQKNNFAEIYQYCVSIKQKFYLLKSIFKYCFFFTRKKNTYSIILSKILKIKIFFYDIFIPYQLKYFSIVLQINLFLKFVKLSVFL